MARVRWREDEGGTHAGADADERRQCAFVEGGGTLGRPNLGGGIECVSVLRCRLKADFDNV